MDTEQMVLMEMDMKEVFAKARSYNRLIAMLSALSDDTLQAMYFEAVTAGHTMALAEMPSDVLRRVSGEQAIDLVSVV